jgi:hypothetical protein
MSDDETKSATKLKGSEVPKALATGIAVDAIDGREFGLDWATVVIENDADPRLEADTLR